MVGRLSYRESVYCWRCRLARSSGLLLGAAALPQPGVMSTSRTSYRLFTLADECHRHLSPTSRRIVANIFDGRPVRQSLQALQKSATPIRLARARSTGFDWHVADKNFRPVDICRRQMSTSLNRGSVRRSLKLLFDFSWNAVRPRYDHSTIDVTTGLLHCGLNNINK